MAHRSGIGDDEEDEEEGDEGEEELVEVVHCVLRKSDFEGEGWRFGGCTLKAS